MLGGTLPAGGGRTSVIRRQIENGWGASQLFFPISDLIGEDVSAEIFALPLRVFSVLHRQFRELGRLAGGKCLIALSQFPEQDRNRPPVGDDVMHDQNQQVLIRFEAYEPRPEQRALGQVEWLLS